MNLVINIKEIQLINKNKDMGYYIMLIIPYTKDNGKEIKNMDKENYLTLITNQSMMVFGVKINLMDMESFIIQIHLKVT